MKDTNKELDRLERELLADCKPVTDEEVDSILDDALLREILAEGKEPAFADPDKIREPAEPMTYCNYSNDYGRDISDPAENGGEEKMAKKKKSDKVLIGLMITASALCLGIIGLLIYWLEAVLI